MNEGFWPIVFALGATQGVLLCTALLVRRTENRTATRLLAAIVGVFATMILAGMLSENLLDPFDDFVIFININTELAIGPLFLLFALSLVDPARRLGRRDAILFLPFVLATCGWVAAWAVLGNGYARGVFLDGSIVPVEHASRNDVDRAACLSPIPHGPLKVPPDLSVEQIMLRGHVRKEEGICLCLRAPVHGSPRHQVPPVKDRLRVVGTGGALVRLQSGVSAEAVPPFTVDNILGPQPVGCPDWDPAAGIIGHYELRKVEEPGAPRKAPG